MPFIDAAILRVDITGERKPSHQNCLQRPRLMLYCLRYTNIKRPDQINPAIALDAATPLTRLSRLVACLDPL